MNARCTAEPATLEEISQAHAELAATFDQTTEPTLRDAYRRQLATLSIAFLQHPDFRRVVQR